MDGKQLRQLKPELDTFLLRYLPLFGREENHRHAERFVHGLLGSQDKRNIENIAEGVEGGVVRTLQLFIAQAAWPDQAVLREVRSDAVETLADEEGTINVDETGFAKKGKKSVGVQRQYSGTLGRVDNCQVGVFANFCSSKGHTLIDRRLFLPEDWVRDQERREEVGVPQSVVFRTRPQLGLEMIQTAVLEQRPFRWVGGDCVYGDSPVFVQTVRELGKWYVLDVSSELYVWTSAPELGEPGPRGARAKPKTKAIPVSEAAAQIQPSAFKRITVSQGSQGPIVYEYAEMTVWFSEDSFPAAKPERLLVRRSLTQEPEVKYHRSNAPREIPLHRLAQQRALRWTIEEDIKAGKGQCGLDEYETRGWIGWHHHTALSILALLFLVQQKLRLKKRPPNDCAGSPRSASSPSRSQALGRRQHRGVEQLAHGAKSRGQGLSRGQETERTSPTK
jgi:SRSO17 transposase